MTAITFNEIRIPAHILTAEISTGAKMLFGIIEALKDTQAAISDAFLAQNLRVSVRTIGKYISELVRNNFINPPQKEIARRYNTEKIVEPKVEAAPIEDEISKQIAKWKALKTPPYGIDVEAEIILLESLRYPVVTGQLPPPMKAFMDKLKAANEIERHAKNIPLYSRHREGREKMEAAMQ